MCMLLSLWCKPYSTNCWQWKTLASSTEDTANSLKWKNFVVVETNCNSLKNISSCMISLVWPNPIGHGIILLSHWKRFTFTNRSTKSVKLPPQTIYNIRYVGKKHWQLIWPAPSQISKHIIGKNVGKCAFCTDLV